ncbi:MAG TPA: hypothetical protein VJ697_02950 [Nitrososphaeraceae archaeon]|nr:hypothetical protein [Nitrososphaeraceae archaeon]
MSSNSFTIKDNNSQILSIVPEEWKIPLIIISYVKGYDGVDEYVLELLRDRLSMFADTRDELGEPFMDYMKEIEGLDDLTNSNEKNVEVKIDADVYQRLQKYEEKKLQNSNEEEEEEYNST